MHYKTTGYMCNPGSLREITMGFAPLRDHLSKPAFNHAVRSAGGTCHLGYITQLRGL